MTSGFSIGEAARRSGCTVATIRYYESIGLIARAARTGGGRREFSRPDIERLRLIRRLRDMQFAVDAIRDLLDAMGGRGSCLDVRDVAAGHLAVLQKKREDYDALARTLVALAGKCSALCEAGPQPDCTIVADLTAA